MSKIREASCLHGFFRLPDIARKLFLTCRRHAAVGIAALISEKMLAKKQVLDRIVIEETEKVVKIGGIVLGLQADMDFDIIPVFVSEHLQRHDIIVKLVDTHAESGRISVGKWVRGVI